MTGDAKFKSGSGDPNHTHLEVVKLVNSGLVHAIWPTYVDWLHPLQRYDGGTIIKNGSRDHDHGHLG